MAEATFELTLKLRCNNPETVKASLEPDIKNDEVSQTTIITHPAVKSPTESNKSFIEIKVKSKKLSHLKAIVNSYLRAVHMLNDVEGKIIGY